MESSIRHIALRVHNLRAAEGYYQSLLGMQLIGREAKMQDGWYSLSLDKTWEDADNAGIRLGMSALRKDSIVLALIEDDAEQGQVFAIGLTLSTEEIEQIRARIPDSAKIGLNTPGKLTFRDRYQITWQIFAPGDDFQTSGTRSGRWLSV